MFKFFQGFLFLMIILSNSFAHEGNSLKKMIDELNYSLSVEWDQKDPDFYAEQISKFESEMSSAGYSKADILEFLRLESSTASMADDLFSVSLLLNSNSISEAEALTKVTQFTSKKYNRGASWNGRTVAKVGAIVVLVAIAVGVSVKLIGDHNYQRGFEEGYGDAKAYNDGVRAGSQP